MTVKTTGKKLVKTQKNYVTWISSKYYREKFMPK